MKTLFFITRQIGPSSDAHLVEAIAKLKASGVECHLLLPNDLNSFSTKITNAVTDYLEIPQSLSDENTRTSVFKKAKDLRLYVKCLVRYFDMHGFEQVHSVGILGHFLSGFLRSVRNFKLVWSVTEIPPRGLRFFFFKVFLDLFCDYFWSMDTTIVSDLGRSVSWRKKFISLNTQNTAADLCEKLSIAATRPTVEKKVA